MQLIDNLNAVKAAQVQVKSYSMTETDRGVAWSCKVYLDGKKLGMISNRGDGGISRFEFPETQRKALYDSLKGQDYKINLTFGELVADEPTDPDSWLEFAIPQIGDELKELAGYKRKMKTGIYVEKKTEPTFGFVKTADTPAVRKQIEDHYGDDLIAILNDKFATL